MALGALIGAYQEDDLGQLRALLPLAGRTLLEYQVRCAAAAGASPIVVVVERIPPALNEALDRLRREQLPVITVSDATEAASRFGAGELVLLMADGVAPPAELLAETAEEQEPVIVSVPDDAENERFERIDAVSRWAGIALVDSQMIGATASMLGDWDLQSTLLRRTLQGGARVIARGEGAAQPVLAESEQDLAALDRQLLVASRGSRRDAASRYLLPVVEDYGTEALIGTSVQPQRVLEAGLLLTVAGAVAFGFGWLWLGLALLLLSTPLDLIARRLASVRLRPLPPRSRIRALLWPAAGIALLALGWWDSRHGGGWGASFAAVVVIAFGEAARIERGRTELPGGIWLFSRRNAIFALVPFAALGAWTWGIVGLATYAAASFFLAQYVNHRIQPS